MQEIYLLSIKPQELVEDIKRAVMEEIKAVKPSQAQEPRKEEYLTMKETAKLLKISFATFYKWKQSGRIKTYGIGRRVYCKRSEIEKALIEI